MSDSNPLEMLEAMARPILDKRAVEAQAKADAAQAERARIVGEIHAYAAAVLRLCGLPEDAAQYVGLDRGTGNGNAGAILRVPYTHAGETYALVFEIQINPFDWSHRTTPENMVRNAELRINSDRMSIHTEIELDASKFDRLTTWEYRPRESQYCGRASIPGNPASIDALSESHPEHVADMRTFVGLVVTAFRRANEHDIDATQEYEREEAQREAAYKAAASTDSPLPRYTLAHESPLLDGLRDYIDARIEAALEHRDMYGNG